MSAVPYYIDGRQVSRREYIEHVRHQDRQAALGVLKAAARQDLDDDQQPTQPQE